MNGSKKLSILEMFAIIYEIWTLFDGVQCSYKFHSRCVSRLCLLESLQKHTQTLFSLFSTATDSTLLSATDVPLMISFVCLFSRFFSFLLDISRQNQYGYALSFIFSANVFCMFYILTVVWLNIQLLLNPV